MKLSYRISGFTCGINFAVARISIRAFLIPHVVKNDIIAKITDLIRAVFLYADAGHIESSTGTKPRDFPL